MMKCPKCGNINESEMTFCGHCGAKLESIPPQFIRSEKPSRNLGIPIGIGAFAAVIIIASFVGFLMIRGNNTVSSAPTPPTKTETLLDKSGKQNLERPKVDVPDMNGISESQARYMLKVTKLEAEVHTSHSAIIPAGQVISQDPKKETSVPEGKIVQVIVSTGPDPARNGGGDQPPTPRQSKSDLDGKTNWELDIMRNEPYARNGLRFTHADLRNYFGQFSWYQPNTEDMNIVENRMSPSERQIIERIVLYQHRTGNRTGTHTDPPKRSYPPPDPPSYSESDLIGKTASELDIMRNQYYAIHGLRFTQDRWRNYFGQFSWYQPNTDNKNTVEHRMSSDERQKVDRIVLYQKRHGMLR